MHKSSSKVNFAAGPACLPLEVIEQVHEALNNFDNTGLSIMEVSHRSKEFLALVKENEERLRDLFSVPEDYAVLMMQGGGTGQFAGIPINMTKTKDAVADYLVTGNWSNMAFNEAKKFITPFRSLEETKVFQTIPDPSVWKFSPDSNYTYYCDNETVHGIEFPQMKHDYGASPITAALASQKVPLVCDMSSNMGSRHFDVNQFGMIFASAQKNMGIPGVCIAFVRRDLMDRGREEVPAIIHWKKTMQAGSVQNTPVCVSMFVLREILRWMAGKGGLDYFEDLSRKKAAIIYDAVDASQGYYMTCVAPEYRSRMNVVFGLSAGDAKEKEFLAQAARDHDLVNLGGHRSVGHMRASVYNAITVENVRHLAEFMAKFQAQHQ